MSRNEVMRIIREGNFDNYSFFEDAYDRENEIVIAISDARQIVYATDERASRVTNSEKYFDSEEKALENFIKRLKALNFLKK